MKTAGLLATCSMALFAMLSTQAQDTFQNLNFEQADPSPAGSPYPAYYVTAASALPHWSVSYGNVQQAEIAYNVVSTGATQASLIGAGAEPPLSPIGGNYSVILEGGGTALGASISQTALIPAGVQSLLFEAQPVLPIGPLEVLIGTQSVPFTAISTGPNYTLYGADISAWDNTPEQLSFSTPAVNTGLNGWEIDDIAFSQTVVSPEPRIVALTAMGGLLFGARKWFARR